jgi:hypothetical protein
MDSLSGNLPQLLIYLLIQLRRECRKAVEMLTPSEKGLAIFRLKGGALNNTRSPDLEQ